MSHQHYFYYAETKVFAHCLFDDSHWVGLAMAPGLPLCLHNYYFKSSLMILLMMQMFQCVRCGHVCAHCMRVSVHPLWGSCEQGPHPSDESHPLVCPDLWQCRGSCLLFTQIWDDCLLKIISDNHRVSSGLSLELYKVSLTSLHGR